MQKHLLPYFVCVYLQYLPNSTSRNLQGHGHKSNKSLQTAVSAPAMSPTPTLMEMLADGYLLAAQGHELTELLELLGVTQVTLLAQHCSRPFCKLET